MKLIGIFQFGISGRFQANLARLCRQPGTVLFTVNDFTAKCFGCFTEIPFEMNLNIIKGALQENSISHAAVGLQIVRGTKLVQQVNTQHFH